jgi:hypothetical protein
MRVTGIQAVVLAMLYLGGGILALVGSVLALGRSGELVGSMLTLPAGVVMIAAFAPAIYRWLRLLPLRLPTCPHCSRRPEAYGVLAYEWPMMQVVCVECNGATELWVIRDVPARPASTDMPRLVVRWPEFWGLWGHRT